MQEIFYFKDYSEFKYVDIGKLRIQWGVDDDSGSDSNGPVTFPTLFANTSYKVILIPDDTAAWSASEINKTTSGFGIDRDNGASGTIKWNWIALGYKP